MYNANQVNGALSNLISTDGYVEGGLFVKKTLNIVSVRYSGQHTLINGWNVLFNIHEGFRPSVTIDDIAVDNSHDVVMHSRIDSAGNYMVWPVYYSGELNIVALTTFII